MGGTVADIVRLLAGEFGRLVLLANLIAWPVAYIAMRRWLDNFAYRVELRARVRRQRLVRASGCLGNGGWSGRARGRREADSVVSV